MLELANTVGGPLVVADTRIVVTKVWPGSRRQQGNLMNDPPRRPCSSGLDLRRHEFIGLSSPHAVSESITRRTAIGREEAKEFMETTAAHRLWMRDGRRLYAALLRSCVLPDCRSDLGREGNLESSTVNGGYAWKR